MTIMRELDYGTPSKSADVTVAVEIDGHRVSVPVGTSVLRAASEAGIPVPKLCATDSLEHLDHAVCASWKLMGRGARPRPALPFVRMECGFTPLRQEN